MKIELEFKDIRGAEGSYVRVVAHCEDCNEYTALESEPFTDEEERKAAGVVLMNGLATVLHDEVFGEKNNEASPS